MLFLDVNVCLYAFRPTASEAATQVGEWVARHLTGYERLGVSEHVLASVIRLATHPRIFAVPATPSEAMRFADALLQAPAVTIVRPGADHWSVFRDLVTRHRLRGNDVPDAYLASLAIEAGASLVTLDRGFRRFDLRTVDPTDPRS
jgi:toxin-antitoxin system PIN domain toxin